MQPALQDGWMLTSLDASDDSKVAETLTALASLVGSATTGGAGTAAKAAKTKPGLQQLTTTGIIPDFSDEILKPGLYKFVYDDASGQLKGLCRVTEFTSEGVKPDECASRTSGK
jgi:hypothetical protein